LQASGSLSPGPSLLRERGAIHGSVIQVNWVPNFRARVFRILTGTFTRLVFRCKLLKALIYVEKIPDLYTHPVVPVRTSFLEILAGDLFKRTEFKMVW
jgi:hypothetical protein